MSLTILVLHSYSVLIQYANLAVMCFVAFQFQMDPALRWLDFSCCFHLTWFIHNVPSQIQRLRCPGPCSDGSSLHPDISASGCHISTKYCDIL